MTMTATMSPTDTLKADAAQTFARKKMVSIVVPCAIVAYLIYVFFAFDVAGLAQRASTENALKLVSDSYSYKTHVTRDNRNGDITVAIEGDRKATYPEGESPDWVTLGDTTVIDMGAGHEVTFAPDLVTYVIPDFGTITAAPDRRGVNATFPTDALPNWINASKNRLTVTTDEGRLTVTKNRTEVFNYFFGWELFWFTLDSPYYNHSVFDIVFGPRIDPERANIVGAVQDFWNNSVWQHSTVIWALFETILMAFLGTCGAAMVALPIAFLAARNFTPFMALREVVRRGLDFLRGVDALIWTIVLARAFGPGPMTGALAILITDTGTFGKIFSEALENVDNKQIEGIQSTGANPIQRYRFGVIPQVTPVLLSQLLYFLESNTRSATVIGAITGGGIGLMLTQAIITQKDWEEVSYYIILIILMVMAMDWISGKLRDRLIKGDGGGH